MNPAYELPEIGTHITIEQDSAVECSEKWLWSFAHHDRIIIDRRWLHRYPNPPGARAVMADMIKRFGLRAVHERITNDASINDAATSDR